MFLPVKGQHQPDASDVDVALIDQAQALQGQPTVDAIYGGGFRGDHMGHAAGGHHNGVLPVQLLLQETNTIRQP